VPREKGTGLQKNGDFATCTNSWIMIKIAIYCRNHSGLNEGISGWHWRWVDGSHFFQYVVVIQWIFRCFDYGTVD